MKSLRLFLIPLLLLGLAGLTGYWLTAPDDTWAPEARIGETEWYQVNWHGDAIGWASIEFGRTGGQSPGYEVIQTTRVAGQLQGQAVEFAHRESLVFGINPPHSLLRATKSVRETGFRSRLQLINDESLQSSLYQNDNPPRHSTGPKLEFTLDDYFASRRWLSQAREEGNELAFPELDWQKLAVINNRYLVLSAPKLDQNFYEIGVGNSEAGWQGLMKFGPGGEPLGFTRGTGMELVRTPVKPQMVASQKDLYFDHLVAIDRPIGQAASVAGLVLTLTSGDGHWFRDQPGLAIDKQGRLHTNVNRTDRLAAGDTRQYLRQGERYGNRDARLNKLARKLVAGTDNQTEQVQRLLNFVSHHLREAVVPSSLTAPQVLDRQAGDCTEFALLFTAMARAVGLPAREVSGLVYLGDERQGFGGHAWVEVAIDGKWTGVDPTWNLSSLSGTHIRLGEGETGSLAMARAKKDLGFHLESVLYL